MEKIMQKKLIVLALASLSGVAYAQSNVTIYGIVDKAFESANWGAGSVQRLQGSGNNTERIGFQGSEALGNGLTANFRLETGFASDTGVVDAAGLFQREARVGLAGGFGSIDAGRQYPPIFNVQAGADVFYVAGIGSNYSLTSTGMTRMSNSVRYTSPNFSGLTMTVGYGFGDTGAGAEATVTPKEQGRHIGLNAIYANGPMALMLGYGNTKCPTAAAGVCTNEGVKATVFGGSYDFGAAKLVAGIEKAKGANTGPGTADTLDATGWLLSGVMPMGAHTFKASYTHLKNNNKAASVTGNSALTALGYEYAMSKRTTLYGTWARMSNDAPMTSTMLGGVAVAADYDPSGIQLGMRHKF